MDVIGMILSEANMRKAVDRVKRNRGAPGVDGMPVDDLPGYFAEHGEEIKASIRNGTYKPSPIRRVYIPKPNGEKRPLGIPTAIDRVVQQAVAQVLTHIFDGTFSEHSHGFRPGRSAHGAMAECLGYLEEGYVWVVDIDIRRFFDTVNHDRLISILRMRMNDARTLRLIRSFLRSGVMENGLATESEEGVPQGSPLSPILSNIYLDRLDKELEGRGLKFVMYADDCNRHAGKKAVPQGERGEIHGRPCEQEPVSGIQVLETQQWLEAQGGRKEEATPKGQGEGNHQEKQGGGKAAGVHVHQAEPNGKGVDKLFQHRMHEDIHGRVRGMDEAQGEGGNPQAMEEASDDIQEPDGAEQEVRLWNGRQ